MAYNYTDSSILFIITCSLWYWFGKGIPNHLLTWYSFTGHLLCARPESGVSVEGVPGVSSSKGDESPGARGTGRRLSVGVEWRGRGSSQRLPGEFCRAKGNWPGGGKSPEMALRVQRPGRKRHGQCSKSMKTGLVKVHEE